jgi:magnesium transporter
MPSTEELSFAYLEAHPVDAARVLERLALPDSAAFLATAPARLTAPVLRQMLPLIAARCLERLDDTIASGLLHGMGAQAGAAVLRHLPESRYAPLLAQLPTTTAIAFRLLLGYSADTVGGWIDPRALALPADLPVRDALERARRSEEDSFSEVYVLDNAQRLRGMVALAELLRIGPDEALERIVRPARYALPARAPLAAIRDHAGWNEYRVLPVVERGERFVGVLTYAVLRRALAHDAHKRDTSAPDTLTGLTRSYWRGVSGMIESLVALLPVTTTDPHQLRTDVDQPG